MNVRKKLVKEIKKTDPDLAHEIKMHVGEGIQSVDDSVQRLVSTVNLSSDL